MRVCFYILITVMLIMFSCSPCKKFYNYDARVLNVEGLNSKLVESGRKKINLQSNKIKINLKFSKSSERLKDLDSIQCSLCKKIKLVEDDFIEKRTLEIQNAENYSEMLLLAKYTSLDNQLLNDVCTVLKRQLNSLPKDKNVQIEIVVPENIVNTDAKIVANEIRSYLQNQGYTIHEIKENFRGDMIYPMGINYQFKKENSSLQVIVWLDY